MAENSVFISYSTQDSAIGRSIYNALLAQDRSLWMDWKSIPFTADWWNEIRDGIETSDNFVFLISPNSIASPICQLEIQYAGSLNKRMIPVLIAPTDERAAAADLLARDLNDLQRALFGRQDIADLARENWKTLSSIHWINLARDGFDAAMAQLGEALDIDLEYVAEHTRLLLRARDWQRRGQLASLLLRAEALSQAEVWLQTAGEKKPPANDIQQSYIAESRRIEDQEASRAAGVRRRTRNLMISTVLFVIVAILLGIVGITALQSREISVAEANAARTEQGQAVAARGTAQSEADAARTAEAQAIEQQSIAIAARATALSDASTARTAEAHAVDQQNTAIAAQSAAVAAQRTAINDAAIARTAEAEALDQQDIARNAAQASIDLFQDRDHNALARMNEIVSLYPQNARAYLFRAFVLHNMGRTVEALADYDHAVELDPTDVDLYLNRGILKSQLGDQTGAMEDYNYALQLDPDHTSAFYNRGLVYVRLGDLDTAIRNFSDAIRLDSNYAEAYYNRGLANALLGWFADAIPDFDAAIRIDPNYAEAYNNRGAAYYYLGDMNAAISDLNIALSLDPSLADAYNNRGLAYGQIGNMEAAMIDFSESIRLNPDMADAYSNRAVATYYFVSSTTKNIDRAAYYQRALDDWDQAEHLGYTLSPALQTMRRTVESELAAIGVSSSR